MKNDMCADGVTVVRDEHVLRGGSCSAACPFEEWGLCSALRPGNQANEDPSISRTRFEKGGVIADEGYFYDGVLVLLSGVVKLFKSLADGRRQIIGFRYPGELVTSRTSGAAWHVSVEAVTPVTLCRIRGDVVRRFRESHPEVDNKLVHLARAEIAAAQDHMLTLGQKAPCERLASFLLEIHRKINGDSGGGTEIHLPMTRTDIGDYLGLKNETVSRVFSKLRLDRIVDLPESWKAVVLDRDALIELSEGERVLDPRPRLVGAPH